jgi:hypothetical protein
MVRLMFKSVMIVAGGFACVSLDHLQSLPIPPRRSGLDMRLEGDSVDPPLIEDPMCAAVSRPKHGKQVMMPACPH